MDKQICSLLNRQFSKELESAYIYLCFASYLDDKGLCGFSHWFKAQSKEEEKHAMMFYDYLHDTNQKIAFMQLSAPVQKIDGVSDILSMSLEHEKYITSLIDEIYTVAEEKHDYATMCFLDWFVKEQMEEEVSARALIDKYSICSSLQEGLYLLDKDLGNR